MSSSTSSQNHESKQDKQSANVSESLDSRAPVEEAVVEEGEGEGEGEELGECPFCLYMKGGGCKDEFVNWENCVEEAEKNGEDVVDKCSDITFILKKCMEANRDYYEPLLRAEEEAVKEFVREGKEGAEATNQTEESKGSVGSATLTGSDTDSQGKSA